jgi:hypothetical protein
MKIQRRISVIVLAAVASLAFAGSALAAPGAGASVVKDSRCQTGPFGTVCSTEQSVFNIADAGTSGNQNVLSNYRFESTFTGTFGPIAGCVSTTSTRSSTHQLVTPDETGQLHFTLTYGSSFDCNGSAIRCTTQTDYTYANDQVRVDATRTACTDPL